MRIKDDGIETFVLAGLITVSQAQHMHTRLAPRSLTRDLRDNLLIHLCAYPLGEAAPRSGLAELEVFARAVAREPDVWRSELNDPIGRHMIDVAATVTRETRDQGRWDLLLPLGAPSSNHWQAAINVYARVLSSRVVDGFLHPVVATDWLSTWPIPEAYNNPELPGITMIGSAGTLFDAWKFTTDREDIEQQMTEMYRAGTWVQQQRGN